MWEEDLWSQGFFEEDYGEEYLEGDPYEELIVPLPYGELRQAHRARRYSELPSWVQRPNPSPVPPMTPGTLSTVPGFVESIRTSGGTIASATVRQPTGQDILTGWFGHRESQPFAHWPRMTSGFVPGELEAPYLSEYARRVNIPFQQAAGIATWAMKLGISRQEAIEQLGRADLGWGVTYREQGARRYLMDLYAPGYEQYYKQETAVGLTPMSMTMWRQLPEYRRQQYLQSIHVSQLQKDEYGGYEVPEGYYMWKGERAYALSSLRASHLGIDEQGRFIMTYDPSKVGKRLSMPGRHPRVTWSGVPTVQATLKSGPGATVPEIFSEVNAAFVIGGSPYGAGQSYVDPSMGEALGGWKVEDYWGDLQGIAKPGQEWGVGERVRPAKGLVGFQSPWWGYRLLDVAPIPESERPKGATGQGWRMVFQEFAPFEQAVVGSKAFESKTQNVPLDLSTVTDVQGRSLGLHWMGELKDIQGYAYTKFLREWAYAAPSEQERLSARLGYESAGEMPLSYGELGPRALQWLLGELPNLVREIHMPVQVSKAALEDFRASMIGDPRPIPGTDMFEITQRMFALVGPTFKQFAKTEYGVRRPMIGWEDLQQLRMEQPEFAAALEAEEGTRQMRAAYQGIINAVASSTGRAVSPVEALDYGEVREGMSEALFEAERLAMEEFGVENITDLERAAVVRRMMDAWSFKGTMPIRWTGEGADLSAEVEPFNVPGKERALRHHLEKGWAEGSYYPSRQAAIAGTAWKLSELGATPNQIARMLLESPLTGGNAEDIAWMVGQSQVTTVAPRDAQYFSATGEWEEEEVSGLLHGYYDLAGEGIKGTPSFSNIARMQLHQRIIAESEKGQRKAMGVVPEHAAGGVVSVAPQLEPLQMHLPGYDEGETIQLTGYPTRGQQAWSKDLVFQTVGAEKIKEWGLSPHRIYISKDAAQALGRDFDGDLVYGFLNGLITRDEQGTWYDKEGNVISRDMAKELGRRAREAVAMGAQDLTEEMVGPQIGSVQEAMEWLQSQIAGASHMTPEEIREKIAENKRLYDVIGPEFNVLRRQGWPLVTGDEQAMAALERIHQLGYEHTQRPELPPEPVQKLYDLSTYSVKGGEFRKPTGERLFPTRNVGTLGIRSLAAEALAEMVHPEKSDPLLSAEQAAALMAPREGRAEVAQAFAAYRGKADLTPLLESISRVTGGVDNWLTQTTFGRLYGSIFMSRIEKEAGKEGRDVYEYAEQKFGIGRTTAEALQKDYALGQAYITLMRKGGTSVEERAQAAQLLQDAGLNLPFEMVQQGEFTWSAPEEPAPAMSLAQQAIGSVGGIDALRAEAERIRQYKEQHGRSAVPRPTLFRQALNAMLQGGQATEADVAEYKAAVESLGVGLNVPSGGETPSHVYTGLFSGGNQPPPPPPDPGGGGQGSGIPPVNVTMPFPEEFRPMMDWFQNYMQKGGIEVFQKGQRKALTAHDVARLQSYGPVLQQYEGMRMQLLSGPLSSWERGVLKVARDIYGDLTGSMQARGWSQFAPQLEDVTNYLPMLESDIETLERREWATKLPLMGAAHGIGQEVLGLSRQDRLTADDVRKAKENLEALGSDELAEAVRQLPGSMKDAARVLDKMVVEYEQQAEAYRPWARDVVTDARKQIAEMESAVDADRMLTPEQRRHAEMYLGLSARGRKPDESHGPEEMRLRRILDRDEELLFRAGGLRAGRGGEALADFLQEFSIGGAAIRMMVVQRYTSGQVAEWERAAMPYAAAGVQMGLAYGLPYSEAMQGPLGQIMEHEAAMRSYQTGLGVSALEQKAGLLGLLGIEPTFQMGRDIGAIGGPILKGLGAGLGVGIVGTTAASIMGKAGIAGAATLGAIAPWAAVIGGFALGGGALAGQLYSASELEAMQRTEAEMAVGIRRQPSFWQRAGMELRDVWLDAWKNVGVYKGPDIYEQRAQELSAYRGTTTFQIDKASVYLENLEGLHLDPAQARELGALLTLGGYSPQQIYGGQAAAAIQQLAPMAQLGQAGAYASAVERFAGYIGVAPGAGMQSLLTMLPTVAQPAQQAQWMLAGQIVGGVGQQIGLPTETVIAKVREYAHALAAGVPTWQVQREVQKELGVSTLAQVAGYTLGSPMAQMIAGAVTTGSEAQSQAVANIASQFRRYWLYQGMGETEMAQRAAALEEARRGTAVEQPASPADPFLAALGYQTAPQAPPEAIPGEQPEIQAIREAAMAGVGYEAFGYLPGSPQARYMGAIQPKGIQESEAWAYVTQFAGPVAQQLGLDQYRASAVQRRFYRMYQRGVSPAAMNLVAQAMTGRGGIEMALGAPAGFAFDERWAQMLDAGTMDPTQYLQLQSLAGLGMGQLGYSMMAGGFGIGAGLAQVMGMLGMAPEPGAQPLILPSGYGLNEQALRDLQWAQLGLSKRQTQLGWEQTQASYEYQMGLGEWGVPGASGWGGGLLGAVQYQKDLIDFTQTLRGITHDLIGLQRTATRHGWEFTERGMEMGFAQQMERLGLSRESQVRQQAFQWQQFGFQWQQMQTTQAWAWEDMAWGRTVAAFEYEYAMDELTRNIRLATGREKQGLLRRREHMEEQFAMQETRRGVEEERLAQRQRWEEEQFHRQRAHFQEMAQLEKNNFEMQERHIRERYQLEKEQFEQQKKDQEAIWSKEDERRAMQEAWEDRSMQYQLEERQRAVQWQEKVFEFQRQRHDMELEAIGYQEQQQKLQDEVAKAQADYMQMQIKAYSPGGIVWEAFNAFLEWLSGQKTEQPSIGYQESDDPNVPVAYDPAPPGKYGLDGKELYLVLDDGTKFNAHIVQTVDKHQANRAQSGGWGRAWN